jgi:multiple sugar transport system ATP-binding protein
MTMGDRVAVMRDGRLEQVDTPQALYDRPANLFVAAFIGSPAMNLVRGHIEDGRLHLGAHVLSLGADAPARGDVIVGIRPEALDHTRQADGDGQTLELPVALVEALGSDTLVHLELDAAGVVAPDVEIELAADGGGVAIAEHTAMLLTARLPPHTRAVPGRVLPVRVDTRALHYFDPETELAL